ncbi:hypothetical protein SLEP1_g17304 [Rubroshorea leprosula]|uniref:Uncharacterized protein n=1 Tax=Rubroshorea leprosula TaxID=152421 RepID=A0AAV5J498_9ROSI|nr:hypothetical protein SLEP1_g17304 [Rubroshorea leprosula]
MDIFHFSLQSSRFILGSSSFQLFAFKFFCSNSSPLNIKPLIITKFAQYE